MPIGVFADIDGNRATSTDIARAVTGTLLPLAIAAPTIGFVGADGAAIINTIGIGSTLLAGIIDPSGDNAARIGMDGITLLAAIFKLPPAVVASSGYYNITFDILSVTDSFNPECSDDSNLIGDPNGV